MEVDSESSFLVLSENAGNGTTAPTPADQSTSSAWGGQMLNFYGVDTNGSCLGATQASHTDSSGNSQAPTIGLPDGPRDGTASSWRRRIQLTNADGSLVPASAPGFSQQDLINQRAISYPEAMGPPMQGGAISHSTTGIATLQDPNGCLLYTSPSPRDS